MTAEMAGFIDSQRTDHGVPHAVSLRALDVAPSTFYKHLNRPLTQMQVRRQALDAEVKKVFGNSRGTYGSPRVRAQLRRDGIPVSKKTVEASMARQGLSARPNKKKGLTSQNPAHNAPEDLLRRDFSASGVNQKWCGDFKEVKTSEGPVFLATVLDLCSRRMVGFATSDDYPTAELAKAAINTAVATRGGNIDGVIFHSDKGSQYTAGAFAAACQRLGIHRSSGRTGNALDNAPAESFFSTLQHELVDRRSWATKAQARQEISLWVHSWYNQRRLHSAIGMVPPVEYEHTHTPNPHNQPLHEKGGSSILVGEVRGRRDRGSNAAGPSARYRATKRVTHDLERPYSAATSAWVRPSTTTAVITKRALDIPHPGPPPRCSYVSRHKVPMS